MANQIIIDIGATANDGTGDPLRTAFDYVNDNFSNVWNTGLPSSNVLFSGNRILTANTNGNLVLAPNGIGKVVANVDIRPNANNTLSLGSSDLRWNSVYAQNLDVGGNVSFNNVTVGGNLTVQGNIIQVGNIVTETLTIQLANAATTANAANGSGITVGASDNIATLLYNSTSNVWTTNIGMSVTGNVTAPYFIGNGSQLTGVSTVSLGNLEVVGSAIKLANGAPNTNVYLTANGVSGNAYISIPSNQNTISDGLTIVNLHGRVEIKAKDGGASQSWYFQEDGSLQLPGDVPAHISSDNDISIHTGAGDHWTFGVDGILTVPGNIVPETSNTQSLGNATNQWSDLWVSNATIYMNSVPIGLTAGNVLTVDGADVVTTAANGESSIGNLDITGTVIEIAEGATDTLINITPSGPTAGWAYLQLPTNDTANTADTRLHNDAGNIEFGTGDFSTGDTNYTWVLGKDGNLTMPGSIIGTTTIYIDNTAYSNSADIRIFSADDIVIQGRDKPDDLEAEGGDISIFAGDGSAVFTGGNTAGGGGDVDIRGGQGGAGEVTGTSGSSGGFVTIVGGSGGSSLDSYAGGGGDINITAGPAANPTGNATLGGIGGDVSINGGITTRIDENGGSILITTGEPTPTGTGAAGYFSISIPTSNVGAGGDWIFSGTGTTLNTPADAEIFGANFGNLTVGCAGNTIVTSADYGVTTYNWVFDSNGGIVFPTLSVTRGDRSGTLTGSTIRIGDGSQEAILTTPDGVDGSDSQRFVINPGAGSEFGEGGDIYLYSGRGGASGGSGGDIKIRGGLAPADGTGGYLDIQGGDTQGNGHGGDVDIRGGESGSAIGGDVNLYGGYGPTNGGVVTITGGQGGTGTGGNVTITGGNGDGLSNYGNVNIVSGAGTWTFDNTGKLTLPGIATGGEGEQERAQIRGTRKIIGEPNYWSTYIDGHSDFGAVAWTASSVSIQSAKITFVVQSGGVAANWEQFDVSVCKFDGANAFVSVSGRIKQNSAIADTQVSAYDNEGGLEVWLNPAMGQTVAYINYNAVEFNIMPD